MNRILYMAKRCKEVKTFIPDENCLVAKRNLIHLDV